MAETDIDWEYYDHGPGSEEYRRKTVAAKRVFDKKVREEQRIVQEQAVRVPGLEAERDDLVKRAEELEKRIQQVARSDAIQGEWDGDEPEGQGLPDGETWAHYCEAIEARERYELLTDQPWTAEAAEAAKGADDE